MTDVFISHAKADRKLIRRLAKALEAEGFDLWYEQNSTPDGKWTPALQRALVDSAAILTCWSIDSVTSEWVRAEASHGKDRNALITVKLNECKIPQPFRELKIYDFEKWRGKTDDPDYTAIVERVRELMKVKSQIGTQAPAPPQVIVPVVAARPAPVAAPPPPEPAKVVAPSAFFSSNLGGPAVARTGRAAPLPQEPPPTPARPAPPPLLREPPQARPLREPPQPVPAPRAATPQPAPRPAPAPPPRIHPIETPPPPARSVQPIDAPRTFRPIDEPAPRPAPRTQPQPAPELPRAVTRAEPVRERDYPIEAPPRKRGGAAKFMTFLIVAGAVLGGGYWASQQFLAPPSAPPIDEAASAPDPLPTAPPTETEAAALPPELEETALAPPDLAPPETAPVQSATAPAAGPPQQTVRATTPARPPAETPATRPGIVIPAGADTAPATQLSEAEVTRQLERCLGRLVRLCPGASPNASRPGFTEDGSLSSAERTLLRQRSLFDFSDVTSAALQNCQRHVAAGQTPALTQACSALPSAGPPG